jgi:hypothetical protein
MSINFDGFNDAIIGEISQIGIEILKDNEDGVIGSILPKTIYEMTIKDSQISNIQNKKAKNIK